MILTVTLNPCVHRYLQYREEQPPRTVVRLVRERMSSGGKGLNAARVIALVGGKAVALSTQSGPSGAMLRECLARERVDAELVAVTRPTRFSTCLWETGQQRFREFLEEGSDVTAAEADELRARFRALLPRVTTVTVNGSTPDGNLAPLPREFVAAARSAGKRVILDAYGPAAAQAASVPPHWIRANLEEMRETFGVQDVKGLPAFLARSGANGLLVSDGRETLHCVTRERRLEITPPRIGEVNAVGSGDALTGAFAFVLDRGGSLDEALSAGAAAGTANAEQLLVCEFEPARWKELTSQVRIRSMA